MLRNVTFIYELFCPQNSFLENFGKLYLGNLGVLIKIKFKTNTSHLIIFIQQQQKKTKKCLNKLTIKFEFYF